MVVAAIRLRTTHCVSAARSPPDHLCRHLQVANTLYKSPLLRTADLRASAVLASKYVCLSLRIFNIERDWKGSYRLAIVKVPGTLYVWTYDLV